MGTEAIATLTWIDYAVFALFIVVVVAIGIYHGYRSRRHQGASDLLTSGQMNLFSLSLSGLCSILSASYILSVPAEVYYQGAAYIYLTLSFCPAYALAACLYFPVYHHCGTATPYEYLERRFNWVVRTCAILVFVVCILLYNATSLYAPAMALSKVTGQPLEPTIVIVGAFIMITTAIGGLKATIWNDVIHITLVYLSLALMVVLGTIDAGGPKNVWRAAEEGGRFNFNVFDPNPLVRLTFWTQVFGGIFLYINAHVGNQAVVQKYLSLEKIRDVQKAVVLSAVFNVIFVLVAFVLGMVIYANYRFCDPLENGKIEKLDHLLAYFVMDTMGDLYGLPGLFFAILFNSGRGTISAGTNALSVVFLDKIVRPLYEWKTKGPMVKSTEKWTARVLIAVFGLATILMSFLVQAMGDLLFEIGASVFGILLSPLFGVLTLAIFCPWVNVYGAMGGFLTSLGITCWIGIGAMVVDKPLTTLYLNTTGCNVTITNNTDPYSSTIGANITDNFIPNSEYLEIYNLSYMYYSFVGFVVTVVIGILISLLSGGNKDVEDIDPDLFSKYAIRCRYLQSGEHAHLTLTSKTTGKPVANENVAFQASSNSLPDLINVHYITTNVDKTHFEKECPHFNKHI